SQNNETHIIDENLTNTLFSNESFYYIYIDSTLYESFLDFNEDKLVPDVNYEWTYRDIEGHYIKKEGTIKGKVNKGDIVVKDGDMLDIAYSKVPDSQIVRVYSQ